MARFEFKLEPLLRQRKAVEDQCQRDLAKIMRQRMILQNQLRSIQQTITQSKRDLSHGLIGRVDLDQIAQFSRYSGQVTQRAHALVIKLAAVEKMIDKARAQLTQAMRDRQALQLLRDRRYEQWRLRQQRLESAQLDEMAVQRYAREAMGVTP